MLLVTFLACPRKVTQRRAPGENFSRHAQSSSVHFGNLPFGLRTSEMLNPRTSIACLNFRMGSLIPISRFSAKWYDNGSKPCLICVICLYPALTSAMRECRARNLRINMFCFSLRLRATRLSGSTELAEVSPKSSAVKKSG